MFKKLTNASVNLVHKWLPDALLFAIILTIICFVAAMGFTGQGPLDMVQHWGNGFWSLLAFAMQMALVVVTGYVLADTKPVGRGLDRLAGLPKTPTPLGFYQETTGPGNRWHYFKKFGVWAQYAFYIEGDIMIHSVIFKQQGGKPTSGSVRSLGKRVEVNAEGDLPAKAVADVFPAYDDDGGMLLVLTPE